MTEPGPLVERKRTVSVNDVCGGHPDFCPGGVDRSGGVTESYDGSTDP